MPRRAVAQTMPAAFIEVDAQGVTHSVARAGSLLSSQLNHADCIGDDILSFPLTVANAGSYQIEAWGNHGGVDCGPASNRFGVTQACWKLAALLPIPSSLTATASVHVRDLLAPFSTAFSFPNGTPDQTAISGTGPEVCSSPANVVSATPFEIQFMLIDSGTEVAVATSTWTGYFKLNGPTPPDQLTLSPGDGRMTASFGYSAGNVDATTDGYTLFCDPPPQDVVAVGRAPDGGVLDCSNALWTMVLMSGQVPMDVDEYRCGQAPLSTASIEVDHLTNDEPYRAGVSAVDTYGNVGPLSKLACALPARAQSENVQACSFSPLPAHSPLGLLGFMASALGLTIRFARSSARARCRGRAPNR